MVLSNIVREHLFPYKNSQIKWLICMCSFLLKMDSQAMELIGDPYCLPVVMVTIIAWCHCLIVMMTYIAAVYTIQLEYNNVNEMLYHVTPTTPKLWQPCLPQNEATQ